MLFYKLLTAPIYICSLKARGMVVILVYFLFWNLVFHSKYKVLKCIPTFVTVSKKYIGCWKSIHMIMSHFYILKFIYLFIFYLILSYFSFFFRVMTSDLNVIEVTPNVKPFETLVNLITCHVWWLYSIKLKLHRRHVRNELLKRRRCHPEFQSMCFTLKQRLVCERSISSLINCDFPSL